MTSVGIKIRFPDAGSAADLELKGPLGMDVAGLIAGVLARVGVSARNSYSVRTDQRQIIHTRLSEPDGSPLAARRAGQVLAALRVAVCPHGADSADGGSRRSGCYPALPVQTAKTNAA
jgi:hypothetical protein